jgi:hypothetical protein
LRALGAFAALVAVHYNANVRHGDYEQGRNEGKVIDKEVQKKCARQRVFT